MKNIFSQYSKTFNFSLVIAGLIMLPAVTFAASAIVNIVTFLETLMSAAFPILIGFGVVVFGYNIMKYLISKNLSDQNLYKAGIWNSLLALFIIFVLFGLIRILATSLGIPVLGTDIGISTGQIAGGDGITSFREIALSVSRFAAQRIIPLLVGGAVLFFIGNIVVSMSKSDSDTERTKMNAYLKWGFIALFVLLTFFGIVSMFTGSLFGTKAIIPQFQTECPSGQEDC